MTTTSINPRNPTTLPMTLGEPVGPNLRVTVSADVESTLAQADVTFGGTVAGERTALWVHWHTQASPHETLIAAKRHPSGAFLASIYVIQRLDDQGRTWSCVTSSSWTAGLFLSEAEAHAFAVEVARRESPSGGWDYAFDASIPAASCVPRK